MRARPCLLHEVLYPPACPPAQASLLDAAVLYHNEADYRRALRAYKQCFTEMKALRGVQLSPSVELYHHVATAKVYESAEQDEEALACYLLAFRAAQQLPSNHPDRALVHSCVGCVYFHSNDLDVALHHFQLAAQMREDLLGPHHVDSALAFNNLAACLYRLQHESQAYKLFLKAWKTCREKLGEGHARTCISQRNVAMVRSAPWHDFQVGQGSETSRSASVAEAAEIAAAISDRDSRTPTPTPVLRQSASATVMAGPLGAGGHAGASTIRMPSVPITVIRCDDDFMVGKYVVGKAKGKKAGGAGKKKKK